MEIYAILAFLVFLNHWTAFLPQDLWKSIGITAIFACRRKRVHFHKNNGNHAKLYNIMQNVVSSRIAKNLHELLIFNVIYAAGNLDIP